MVHSSASRFNASACALEEQTPFNICSQEKNALRNSPWLLGGLQVPCSFFEQIGNFPEGASSSPRGRIACVSNLPKSDQSYVVGAMYRVTLYASHNSRGITNVAELTTIVAMMRRQRARPAFL
jgi:hypothetical protein